MRTIDKGIRNDETAQAAAEYLMLLGGILVIVLVAIFVYQDYVDGLGDSITNGSDVESIKDNLTEINDTLKM
ncbi:MAG: hypothetical protein PWQ15_1437 [Methanobacterium sp.]|jgi:hypothetical protein|uniref:hypothetical protein n=1 Tax=Methanobacterium sp. TaxID=2164 RepID=UPI0003C9556B|nr:hypothetical protein [Methanobacterium sp.]MDI3550334.1 hypothetical protein [Methanobacterium sp.]CDG65672.1 hypothetical protein MBMB1_1580 [Methanobacterium sp. MB1]